MGAPGGTVGGAWAPLNPTLDLQKVQLWPLGPWCRERHCNLWSREVMGQLFISERVFRRLELRAQRKSHCNRPRERQGTPGWWSVRGMNHLFDRPFPKDWRLLLPCCFRFCFLEECGNERGGRGGPVPKAGHWLCTRTPPGWLLLEGFLIFLSECM